VSLLPDACRVENINCRKLRCSLSCSSASSHAAERVATLAGCLATALTLLGRVFEPGPVSAACADTDAHNIISNEPAAAVNRLIMQSLQYHEMWLIASANQYLGKVE